MDSYEKILWDIQDNLEKYGAAHMPMQCFVSYANALNIGKIVHYRSEEKQIMNERVMYDDKLKVYEHVDFEDIFHCNRTLRLHMCIYKNNSTIPWTKEEKNFIHKMNCLYFTYGSREALFKQLLKSVYHDQMTKLVNANGFTNGIREYIQNGKIGRYTGIYFNLKDMGTINQRYGFDFGNKVIVSFSEKLNQLMKNDEILGRLGGDNFVAMIRTERCLEILDQLAAFSLQIFVNEKPVSIVLSVRAGVSDFSEVIRPEQAMQRISKSFMVAKMKQGPDIVYYNIQVEKAIQMRDTMKNRLKSAIENDEFIPYFQPKVDLKTLQLSGAETLVRWKTEDKMVYPDQFIPLAEETGLIKKIDFLMLHKVCQCISEWKNQGYQMIPVSVNFSKMHLYEDRLAERIMKVIKQYEIEVSLIEIEFTETAFFSDQLELLKVIEELKNSGIKVSMDDFGSGYSTLGLLHDAEFDILKLDKSLVDNGEEMKNFVILKHIIAMAKDLNMNVVCEGVEHRSTCLELQKMNCDVVQGYIFDKPLPKKEFLNRVKSAQYSLE